MLRPLDTARKAYHAKGEDRPKSKDDAISPTDAERRSDGHFPSRKYPKFRVLRIEMFFRRGRTREISEQGEEAEGTSSISKAEVEQI